MLKEELERIKNNLELKADSGSKDSLFDLDIATKKEKLSQAINAVRKRDDSINDNNLDIINKAELSRYEIVLRNEIIAIKNVQEAVFENDSDIASRIDSQQMKINNQYCLFNWHEAQYRYDGICDGLFLKFGSMIYELYKDNLLNMQKLNYGNVMDMVLIESEKKLLLQLNDLIRCIELDSIRIALLNIVKKIMIKMEREV